MHLLRKHTARLRPVHLFMWDERNGFDMTILVIDGQGGKLGKRLVESIKKSFPQVEVMAVGTNSAASESMMRAGADRVATGADGRDLSGNGQCRCCQRGLPGADPHESLRHLCGRRQPEIFCHHG